MSIRTSSSTNRAGEVVWLAEDDSFPDVYGTGCSEPEAIADLHSAVEFWKRRHDT